jgi:hypothetical protein
MGFTFEKQRPKSRATAPLSVVRKRRIQYRRGSRGEREREKRLNDLIN